MAFILELKNGESVTINAWNWRPTLELLRDAKLIDQETYERMGTQICCCQVNAETARRIADFLDLRLRSMSPEQRILADLTTTDAPKNKVVFTPETDIETIDAVDLYSATYEWLVIFRDFGRKSGGFKVW